MARGYAEFQSATAYIGKLQLIFRAQQVVDRQSGGFKITYTCRVVALATTTVSASKGYVSIYIDGVSRGRVFWAVPAGTYSSGVSFKGYTGSADNPTTDSYTLGYAYFPSDNMTLYVYDRTTATEKYIDSFKFPRSDMVLSHVLKYKLNEGVTKLDLTVSAVDGSTLYVMANKDEKNVYVYDYDSIAIIYELDKGYVLESPIKSPVIVSGDTEIEPRAYFKAAVHRREGDSWKRYVAHVGTGNIGGQMWVKCFPYIWQNGEWVMY